MLSTAAPASFFLVTKPWFPLPLAHAPQGEADGSMEFSEMQVSRNTTRLMAEDVARDGYGLLLHLGDIRWASDRAQPALPG